MAGKIDALETQALAPGLDDPAVLEWYRFLDLGYRLPIVAGTDKMSAEVPVGAVRAYVHLLSDDPLTFDTWAAAVRAGRTFVTSGPILELAVDGHEPGDVIRMRSAGRLEAAVRVAGRPAGDHGPRADRRRAGGGRRRRGQRGVTALELHETVEIGAGAWIAARSRSANVIESAFTTSMAAHTSPVYVEVDGRPFVPKAEAGGRRRADHRGRPDLGRRAGRGRRARPSGRGWSPSSMPAWRRSGSGSAAGPLRGSRGQAGGSTGIAIGRPVQSSAIQA